ncbi:hypothetical protein [Paenibacillus rhizoplanae]|uniref:Uncharacterized protein n=1 Tax=Paenibacillus rhizoplanae TaxID=1917181 RepID=A0ABW5F0W9_9BACL
MKNKGKLVIATLVVSAIFTTTSVFAVTASFSGSLPANQGDTEISTLVKSSDMPGFNIIISSLGSGSGNYVRAWAEKDGFWTNPNLSSPYNNILYDSSSNNGWVGVSYDIEVPATGTKVTLNLDNPVNISSSVTVSGQWTPN